MWIYHAQKNQVSAVVSPADSTHGANAWQKAEEPHESPTSAGSDEPHDESMDMDTLIDEPERIVQHSIRRFKRYSRSWAALSLHASNHRSAHPLVDLPSTQILEEEMENEDDDPAQALLKYFRMLSDSNADIDFAYIENILSKGADINATEQCSGKTVMHKVAEKWDTSVAQFLHNRGIDIHCADNKGKTPLHIAAGTNHKEMVKWLISQGADIEVETNIERQTAVHYAARNDSVNALQVLIESGGSYETKDYKGRTPLHLAAELDRTLVADFFISLERPAKCTVTDKAGSHVITSMIRTMPQVAAESLDQLHKLAPADRKQYYMLGNLEHSPGDEHAKKGIKSPFEMAVELGRHEILTHKAMQELIRQKWKHCVRGYYYTYLGLYSLFLISWSILISYPSVQLKHIYQFPTDVWRIVLQIIALGTYIHQIAEEIVEIIQSNLKHKRYIAFRQKTLQDDLANTDSSLPGEQKYLMTQLQDTKKSPPNYFRDLWNILDIATYISLLVVIILHVADIALHSPELAVWTARFSSVAVLLIWVRLLKLVRALQALGPLVAIIGELLADILRYFAIYLVFFIPYIISVWVLFGGDQAVGVAGNEDLTLFYRVVVVMFRMSLIDEFPYETMRDIDELMTVILVITFLIITAVVGLNLFIALLSDTFQRVYDNAQANALLQQARLILLMEGKVSSCTYQRYLTHIQNNCNPYLCFYDDDENTDDQKPTALQKITHQIHNLVEEFQNERREMEDRGSAGVSSLREKLEEQDSKLLHLSLQIEEIKSLFLSNRNGHGSLRSQPSLYDNGDRLEQTLGIADQEELPQSDPSTNHSQQTQSIKFNHSNQQTVSLAQMIQVQPRMPSSLIQHPPRVTSSHHTNNKPNSRREDGERRLDHSLGY